LAPSNNIPLARKIACAAAQQKVQCGNLFFEEPHMRLKPTATAFAALLASSSAAFAHPGHGDTAGFAHGFMHPLGGLDHVLAMVAVGLLAAHLGGRALWLVPSAFMAAMAAAGALGMAGVAIPYAEAGIMLSIVVLGLVAILRIGMPVSVAMALAGFFAIFHGYAHGAEMPAGASGLTYAAGFLAATALLHAAGIAIGLATGRLIAGRRAAQAAAR
jgi:urease accessory protein